MAQRIGGTIIFRRNGAQYSARGSFKYSPFLFEKTGVAGQDEPHGFTEKPRLPSIEGDISDIGAVSVSDLQNADDAVWTLELANGKVIVLTGGWVSGSPDVETEDGKFSIKLEGMFVQEIIAA